MFRLHGILKNYEGNNAVVVRKPVNGFYNSVSFETTDTVKIQDNEFIITVACNKPVFFLVEVYGEYLNIIATPGGMLQIILDYSTLNISKKAICTFTGSNAHGQAYFHAYNYVPASKYENVWSVLKKSGVTTFVDDIRKEINRQITPFDSLLQNKLIDKEYHELVSSTIKMWLLIEAVRRIGDFNLQNVAVKRRSERITLVNRLFLLLSPKNDFIFYGKNSIYYTQLYYSFKRSLRTGSLLYNQPDTTIFIESSKYVLTGVFAAICEIETQKLKEFVFASYLIDALSVHLEEVLKDEIIYFKNQFPASPFNPVIEHIQTIKRNERAQERISGAAYFPEMIPEIADMSEKYKDFSFDNDIRFKDKLIYVDIWATWCGPCLKEMSYNFRTDSFLYVNGMKRIYISIDNPSQVKRWEEVIFQKHLGGFHILAGRELNQLLSKTIGLSEGLIAIPRYMVIKNGIILISDASRPSDFENLKEQLQGLTNKDPNGE